MTARRARIAGFTLLEVLVAFTVLALIAVPAAQVVGNNLRSLETGARYTHATSVARSVLDEVRARRVLRAEEMARSGVVEAGGVEYAWALELEPYTDDMLGEDASLRPGLEQVTVTVSWGERSLALETLILDIEP